MTFAEGSSLSFIGSSAFENDKKLEFNTGMLYEHQNILRDINPNLNDEIYDMVQVIDFDENKAEFYHDMNKDETLCIFK